MKDFEPRGAVHWIDHYVVGTNDLSNWADWANKATGLPLRPINGLTTNMRKKNTPIFCFMWWEGGSCRMALSSSRKTIPRPKSWGKTCRAAAFISGLKISARILDGSISTRSCIASHKDRRRR